MTTRVSAAWILSRDLFRLEEEHGERRQGERERVAELLVRHRLRVRAALVAHAAAAVVRSVAVEELAPAAAARHAHAVVVARDRGEVANHEHRRTAWALS